MHEAAEFPRAIHYGDTEPISAPDIRDCNEEPMGMVFKDHTHFAFAGVLHDG